MRKKIYVTQRRDDDASSREHQRGNLVADGLSAACREERKCILSFEKVSENGFLRGAEGLKSKKFLQELFGGNEEFFGCGHRVKWKRTALEYKTVL